jgi:hypothetical protein
MNASTTSWSGAKNLSDTRMFSKVPEQRRNLSNFRNNRQNWREKRKLNWRESVTACVTVKLKDFASLNRPNNERDWLEKSAWVDRVVKN